MNVPLFSVISAVFNDKVGLERTARSLQAQSCLDFEWIVIDGGSDDGTVEFLQGCIVASQWISEPDDGIADAWNKGIRLAVGRFVVILNAGDTFDPDYLETMRQSAVENRITCCAVRLANSSGSLVGKMVAEPGKLWRGMHVPHNWCVVPRHLYSQFGGYPKRRFAMDFAWFHRYFQEFGVEGFIVIPRVLGTYHLGGVSDSGFRKSFAEVEQILRENGMSRFKARCLRIGYTIKHGIALRLRSHFADRKLL
ncbi:MAG TPA: glycosyltransferase [Terracidiphilus sp.]|nr:glycosyltransferase [Terracidiphilus sp.]